MLRLFNRKSRDGNRDDLNKSEQPSSNNIPKHVAVIMDGNGRWAKERGLPRIAGHHSGMKAVKKITMAADRLGVEILTMYAFSTENWKRPQRQHEISFTESRPIFWSEIQLCVRKLPQHKVA